MFRNAKLPGAIGRPPLDDRGSSSLNVRVSDDLHAWLGSDAYRAGLTTSSLVRIILELYRAGRVSFGAK